MDPGRRFTGARFNIRNKITECTPFITLIRQRYSPFFSSPSPSSSINISRLHDTKPPYRHEHTRPRVHHRFSLQAPRSEERDRVAQAEAVLSGYRQDCGAWTEPSYPAGATRRILFSAREMGVDMFRCRGRRKRIWARVGMVVDECRARI